MKPIKIIPVINTDIDSVDKLRNRMINNARAYNKHLPESYLHALPINRLMSHTHPSDRDYFLTTYINIYKKLSNG